MRPQVLHGLPASQPHPPLENLPDAKRPPSHPRRPEGPRRAGGWSGGWPVPPPPLTGHFGADSPRLGGGGGYWAVAVLFVIGLFAVGAFILYKFKRQGLGGGGGGWGGGGGQEVGGGGAWGAFPAQGHSPLTRRGSQEAQGGKGSDATAQSAVAEATAESGVDARPFLFPLGPQFGHRCPLGFSGAPENCRVAEVAWGAEGRPGRLGAGKGQTFCL